MKAPFIAVELDSPAGGPAGGPAPAAGQGAPEGSSLEAYLRAARRLADAGADLITIADNPLASPRADSALMAALLCRETGIRALPHLACRDRNRNALISSLLALDLAGVHEVLAVTGDPLRSEDRERVKSLASFDASGLAALIAEGNRSLFSRPFSVSAALNVNAPNFDAELRRAERKTAAGVSRFLSQPVLSAAAARNLARAQSALAVPILAGILPIVSERNARFLAEKVPGIRVDPGIILRYEGADRDRRTELAVELSLEAAESVRPSAAGYYLITPFRRVDIVERILAALSASDRDRSHFHRPGEDFTWRKSGSPLPRMTGNLSTVRN